MFAYGVTLEAGLVRDYMANISDSLTPPSEFMARTICRSDIIVELMGDALSKSFRSVLHTKEFYPDIAIDMVVEPTHEMLSEAVQSRSSLSILKKSALQGSAR